LGFCRLPHIRGDLLMAKIMLTVSKGALIPASRASEDALRALKLRVGDNVLVEISRPRNPGFFRLAHAFGRLLAENLEDFEGLDWHDAIKKVQRDGRIECDISQVQLEGNAVAEIITPHSLSFQSMSEDTFRSVYQRMCDFVAKNYWQQMTAEKISEMAEVMTNE